MHITNVMLLLFSLATSEVVTPPTNNGSHLSTGAIIGIVCGVVGEDWCRSSYLVCTVEDYNCTINTFCCVRLARETL